MNDTKVVALLISGLLLILAGFSFAISALSLHQSLIASTLACILPGGFLFGWGLREVFKS